MDINFYKIQISGNDLLLVNQINIDNISADLLSGIAKDICKRNKGVGSNGIIFLYSGKNKELKIKFYNSKGSSENISYDAVLCSAKYIFDYGLAGSNYIVINTDFGVFTVDCIDSTSFRISLGNAYNEIGEIISGDSLTDYSEQVVIEGRSTVYTPVTLKDTGISVFFSNKQKNDKKEISNYFRQVQKKRPYRTAFVTIFNEEEIGVETYSQYYRRDNCFISAIAGAASVLNGLCDRELTIYYKSDTLFFQWDKESKHIYISGQPAYVFSGNYYYEVES
jgi:diaminopimelate epimerase